MIDKDFCEKVLSDYRHNLTITKNGFWGLDIYNYPFGSLGCPFCHSKNLDVSMVHENFLVICKEENCNFSATIINDEEAYLRSIYAPSSPKCPTCGSTNVRPIGTGKRVISTLTFGIASGTMGKSYECLNCKYKW